jgi:hypothetical protein
MELRKVDLIAKEFVNKHCSTLNRAKLPKKSKSNTLTVFLDLISPIPVTVLIKNDQKGS